MLLITFADEYLGYCLTSHLAQHKHLRKEIRVLCQASSKPSPCIANFRTKEIDVCPVDYYNPNNLSKCMRNVDQMILCMSHHPERVHYAQQLIKFASQSGVQSIVYLSHVGALTHFSALGDYGQVETYLIQTCQDISWTILRLDWIQQYFHYWSCQVESKRKLQMPLGSDVGISPVHITDLCEIVSRFVVDNGKFIEKIQEQHTGQVYTITGPERLTPKEIIQQMSNATQFQGFKYQTERPMDTLYYLKELAHNIWFDERLKCDQRQVYHDPLNQDYLYKARLLSVLEDKQIQTFLNYFEWVNQFSGSVSVEHTQQLLADRKSSGLQVYFNENAIAFKPKV